MKTTLITRALLLAYEAHEGQIRKYTGEPYICHPISVAAITKEFGGDDIMIAASLLHDVVEDTSVTNKQVANLISREVAVLVEEVTDVSRPDDGNRAKRKELDRLHIAQASIKGQEIKLADLIDNTKSISAHDKNFSKVYLKEKQLILDIIGEVNPLLHKLAQKTLNDALYKLHLSI